MVQVIAQFLARLSRITKMTGGGGRGGEDGALPRAMRLGSAFHVDGSTTVALLARWLRCGREANTSFVNEHSYLLFFGFLVAGWQADELFLFASLSLAGRHCQRIYKVPIG